MTSMSTPDNEQFNETGKEVQRANPDPHEILRRSQRRAAQDNRDVAREIARGVSRGGAFYLGKEVAKRIVDLIEMLSEG